MVDQYNSTLRFESSGDGNAPSLQTWELGSESYVGFALNDILSNRTPFTVQKGAPTSSLYVSTYGSVGVGTNNPGHVFSTALPGQALNLANATYRTTLIAQGGQGGYLQLVHTHGTAQHRIFQMKLLGSATTFDIVGDSQQAVVPNVLNFNMANGFVGVGIAAVSTKPLAMKSGAYVTTGGVWTNASSREVKQDIEPLTIEQARETVHALNPVGFRYKEEPDEQYLGFIAEDVPELVATNDRKSLAPMDITAVLTKVVQDQDAQIREQKKLLAELAKEVRELRQIVAAKDSAAN
jgi:hypothetical protein